MVNSHLYSKGPSLHLTWKELSCQDGTPYPSEWRKTRAVELGEIFELIRSECGSKPITVLSAYRTGKWNRKIGGARKSQHLQGRALDLKPPDGFTIDEFYQIMIDLAEESTIRGIGKYLTFIHVDIRHTSKVVYWTGNGIKDSLFTG